MPPLTPENMHKSDEQIIQLLITHNRAIYGDEKTGEVGMLKKINEVHGILTSARNVGGFFNGIGKTITWILIFAGLIAAVKGWWAAIIHSIVVTVKSS